MTDKKMAPRAATREADSTEVNAFLSSASDDKTDEGRDARARERATRNVRKYIAWKSINAHAYSMLCDVARARAEAGGVVSGGDLLRWLRSHDVVNDLGRPCRPNNDYAAPLIRDICLHNPVVGPHVETRTSVYDEIGLMDMIGGEA